MNLYINFIFYFLFFTFLRICTYGSYMCISIYIQYLSQLVFYYCAKYHDQKMWRKKMDFFFKHKIFITVHCLEKSSEEFNRTATLRQELSQKPWTELISVLLQCFAQCAFSYKPESPFQGCHCPQAGPSHQKHVMKMVPRLIQRLI